MNYLEKRLAESKYNFFFLVVDENLDIRLPSLKNFQSIYLQDLKTKNSGYLLSLPSVQTQISQSQNPVVVPFKPSAKIDLICQKKQWLNASNPAKINRLLEDKIKFFELAKKEKLPILPGFTAPFSQESFNKAQGIFSKKIVTQTHFGWAGNSTHSFSDYHIASSKIAQNVITKFSPYIENSYSLTNNCVLTRHGLIQSPPALQFTGIDNLSNNPFATVGRQWPSFAPPSVLEKVKSITKNFSNKILKPLNYRGFFGLDFIVSEDNVYLLECNPRLTASFAFYTQLELKQNLNPLFYFHLAEFINLDYSPDFEQEQSRFYNSNLIGSELTPRDNRGTITQKINLFEILSKSTNPVSLSTQAKLLLKK